MRIQPLWLRRLLAGATVALGMLVSCQDHGADLPAPAMLAADASTVSQWRPPTAVANTVGVVTMRSTAGAICSAVPIADTPYIVTAAHCLVNEAGVVQHAALRIEVDHTPVYNPVESFVLPFGYFNDRRDAHDVAILTTERPWHYGVSGVGLGDSNVVSVDAYAVQSIDEYGRRLTPDDLREIDTLLQHCVDETCREGLTPPRTVTTCAVDRALYQHGIESVTASCGFVFGASGGPVVATLVDGRRHLVGVVSTVYTGWRINGFAPGSVVAALLEGDGIVIDAAPFPPEWQDTSWPRSLTPSDVARAVGTSGFGVATTRYTETLNGAL